MLGRASSAAAGSLGQAAALWGTEPPQLPASVAAELKEMACFKSCPLLRFVGFSTSLGVRGCVSVQLCVSRLLKRCVPPQVLGRASVAGEDAG